MKCPYCEQEIPDGSLECPVCSKKLMEAQSGGEAAGETSSQSKEQNEGAPASVPAVPEKKQKKVWIAGVTVAAIAAVGGVAFWQMNRKDPKNVVIDAFKGVVAKGQTNPGEEIFGWKSMNEKMYKGSYEMNMGLSIGQFMGDTEMQGAGFSLDAREDREKGAMDMDFGLQYGGMDVMNAKVYLDSSELAFALPDMTDKVFSLNLAEDLNTQIANSPYLGKNMSDVGIDLQSYADYMKKVNELSHSETPLFDVAALWDRYKTGSEAINNLKAAMTVEKGEKKSFTIDGKEQECSGYDVVLTKDSLVQFFDETKDFFLEDETLKKDMITYLELLNTLNESVYGSVDLSAVYGLDSTGEDMTPEKQQVELWTSTDEELEELLSQLEDVMGDVNLAVYVTNDGKLASFDYSTTVSEKTSSEDSADVYKIYGTVEFKGGYNQLANVDSILTAENPQGEKVIVTVIKTGEYEKGKSYSAGLNLNMLVENQEVAFDMMGNYNIKDGAYMLSVSAVDNDVEVGSITVDGVVEDLVPGESFNVQIDSLKVEAGNGPESMTLAELYGNFGMGIIEGGISKPEGESFDILAATEEDWNAVIMELYLGLMSMMSSLS